MLIYPFGADISGVPGYEGEKFEYLKGAGYSFFFNVDGSVPAWGQSSPAPELARQWRHQHERVILDEFVTLLSVPNTPGDHDNIQRNAALLLRMMQKRGITSRLLSVRSPTSWATSS